MELGGVLAGVRVDLPKRFCRTFRGSATFCGGSNPLTPVKYSPDETSNALYALVWSKHKRFQILSECISANSRIIQVVLARNSTQTDQPQRKRVRWCLAGNVERPVVVSWQIEVVDVMWRWRSDGRNPSSTVELGHAYSCTSWCSACMRLAQVHQASVARCAGAATSYRQTCLYRSPPELGHSTLVATCPSLLLERLLGERCSSQCVTLPVHGRAWPPIWTLITKLT